MDKYEISIEIIYNKSESFCKLFFIFVNQNKKHTMKKFFIKIFDKLLVSLLFSVFFISSCDEPEPIPEYGVLPMYGVPSMTIQQEVSAPEITDSIN